MSNPSETARATPRTDALHIKCDDLLPPAAFVAMMNLARQLERELSALAAENERLKILYEDECSKSTYRIDRANVAESELSRVKEQLAALTKDAKDAP